MSDRYWADWERQHRPRGGGEHSPVTALVLGILGLVACGICAPFAWYIGSRAYAETGDGLARAGQVLGIIGTVFWVLGILIVFSNT